MRYYFSAPEVGDPGFGTVRLETEHGVLESMNPARARELAQQAITAAEVAETEVPPVLYEMWERNHGGDIHALTTPDLAEVGSYFATAAANGQEVYVKNVDPQGRELKDDGEGNYVPRDEEDR